MNYNYTKHRCQTLFLLLFSLLMHSGLSAQCTEAPAIVVPNEYTSSAAALTFLGPLANAQRTYQLLIHSDQTTDLVGKQLTGLTFRIPANSTVAWPASAISFANYDIYLSQSVAPADRSLTFANNVVGPQTQVRNGSLSIAANAFPFGSDPNAFGVNIQFDMPYSYAGGHLLVEIRHTGFTGTSRSIEAVGTSVAGYGTQFSAAWTGNYTGTSGSQGNFGVVRFTAQECETVIVCPSLTAAAPAVTVVNSSCNASCTLSAGSISAPTGSCPAGSTLQYSSNGGASWNTFLPAYNQAGPAQAILTRCNCDSDTSVSSPLSSVSTTPGGCVSPFSPSINITNNVCPSTTGSISASGCGAGTVLEYATSVNGPWSTTAPPYTEDAFTIYARCRNTTTNCLSSISSGNTSPEECPVCPNLSAAAPQAQVVNSTCNNTCTLINGYISGANKCPFGSTIEYSVNSGSTWSTTVPTYSQSGPQTIMTRCNCNIDITISSPSSSITTAPANCNVSAAPSITITNNVCPSTSGVISATGCAEGYVVEYAPTANGRWSNTPPTYTTAAFTVYARCRNTTTNCVSAVASATTAPTACPANNTSPLPGNAYANIVSQLQPDFSVYPNPTSGELNLFLQEYTGRNALIEIFSLEGALLKTIRIDEVHQTTETIHLDAYPAGMYLLKLKSAGLPDVTKRVVLTKN